MEIEARSIIVGQEKDGEEKIYKDLWDEEEFGKAYFSKVSEEELKLIRERQKEWAEKPEERVELFFSFAKEMEKEKEKMIELLMKETGKTRKLAEGEVKAFLEEIKLVAEAYLYWRDQLFISKRKEKKGRIALLFREPYGVVFAISPFNYPLMTSALKVLPALIAGNAVILKPSSLTPFTAYFFARKAFEHGLELHFLCCKGSQAEDVISSQYVDVISFTGSTAVARRISSIAGLKRQIYELGGKGIAIVYDDADLEKASEEVAIGGLKFSGQRCDALSIIFVHADIYDSFIGKMIKKAKGLARIDKENGIFVPLMDKEKPEKLKAEIEKVKERVILEGNVNGRFMGPFFLENVPFDNYLVRNELFAPIMIFYPFREEKTIIKFAEDIDYGLDASIFTYNMKNLSIAKRLPHGSITINAHPSHGTGYFPFGGNRKSGLGREGPIEAIEEFTRLKKIEIVM